MKSRRLADALKIASEANKALGEALEDALKSRDPFVVFIADARRQYRYAVDHGGKSGKEIEAALRSTWNEAQKRGFEGSIREWKRILNTDIVGAWKACGDLPAD